MVVNCIHLVHVSEVVMFLTGKILRRQSGIVIGAGSQLGHFYGNVDNVSTYSTYCKFILIRWDYFVVSLGFIFVDASVFSFSKKLTLSKCVFLKDAYICGGRPRILRKLGHYEF